jgi:hypothetical protein
MAILTHSHRTDRSDEETPDVFEDDPDLDGSPEGQGPILPDLTFDGIDMAGDIPATTSVNHIDGQGWVADLSKLFVTLVNLGLGM